MNSAHRSVTITARAKVNLCLHVIGRRADGLHALESLVVFPEFGDELEAWPAARFELQVDAASHYVGDVPTGDDNLVLRAARALARHFGTDRGAEFQLRKRIPVGAGLGGGSADAAATVRLLAELWDLDLESTDFDYVAWQLGADVPVCLRGQNSVVRGAGEQTVPAPRLPDCWLVLLRVGGALPTASVFAEFAKNPQYGDSLPQLPSEFSSLDALVQWLQTTRNDLVPTVDRLVSARGEAEHMLQRAAAMYCGMSGSGLTHYGIFADQESASAAAASIRAAVPGCWCIAAPLGRTVSG